MASNFLLIRRLNRNFSQILAKPKPESIDSLHDEIARDLSMEFFLTIKKEFEGFRTLFFDNLKILVWESQPYRFKIRMESKITRKRAFV